MWVINQKVLCFDFSILLFIKKKTSELKCQITKYNTSLMVINANRLKTLIDAQFKIITEQVSNIRALLKINTWTYFHGSPVSIVPTS